MSRRSRFLTPRRVKLTLVFVLAVGLFHVTNGPRPESVVHTEDPIDDGTKIVSLNSGYDWRSVMNVSADGGHVIVGVHTSYHLSSETTKLERWNTRTGTEETPPLWADED